MSEINKVEKDDLFELCLRLGDDCLILGQRLAEWCGHAPILEEDIALTNISLDLLGQAISLYKYACELEGKARTEDDLAYFRNSFEFKNSKLVEQPNGDFAVTILRQFIFDSYSYFLYSELKNSADATISAIAEKSLKEIKYHLRHSSEWVIRLGDGTEESHMRIIKALNELWRFSGELFEEDELSKRLKENGYLPDMSAIYEKWKVYVKDIFNKATLELPPEDTFMQTGGRRGNHTEHLDYILAVMQILPRSYPTAKW